MAIGNPNLENAAMNKSLLAISTGVNPYETKNYPGWLGDVPAAGQYLPGAIQQQRQRQVTELEKGIPEHIRRSAQPLARRGLHSSGLQLEDIGQASLDRQIAIDRAKSLAEIDPIKAQIELQNLARDRYVSRGKEEQRTLERQQDETAKQRELDQRGKQGLMQSLVGILGTRNPISDMLFKSGTGIVPKAYEKLFGPAIGATGSTSPYANMVDTSRDFTEGGESGDYAPLPGSQYDPNVPYTGPYPENIISDDRMHDAMQYGRTESGLMDEEYYPHLQNIYGSTPDYSIPMEDDKADQFKEFYGPGRLFSDPETQYEGYEGTMDQRSTEFDDLYGQSGEFLPFQPQDRTTTDFSQGIDDLTMSPERASEFMNNILNMQELDLETGDELDYDIGIGDTEYKDAGSMFLNQNMKDLVDPDPYFNPNLIDFNPPDVFSDDMMNKSYLPFHSASDTTNTDASEAMRKAMDQGFSNAEITQKLLDEGKIGTEYASLLSDAGNYLPESGTDLLSTAGDIAKLPFKALDLGLEAVGSAKRTVGDLTTKALDAATGGAYSGIRGLGGQATKAVSEALGGVVSPSTVGSAAFTALRGKEGLKSIAKDPFGFAGKKILSSALPSFKSTVSALAKGSLPSLPGASLGAKALASNIAYDAALAKGLSLAQADKIALSAYSTGANALLSAAPVAIPMILSSIGSMEKKKSRAKEEREEIRNRAGSAPFNFVPGELWMAGNKRRSPTLDEANRNFMMTDQLTGMGKIYLEDPRRSVMDGDSLSKRGQDFAKEAGIDYKHSDPDVQNTSQKWLGKQQLYSELIPDLKPIFMAGLKGEMSREETEDAVSFYSNKFFKENPAIGQINGINNRIKDIEHQEADEIWSVQDKIMALKEQANQLYQKVPLAWRNVSGLMPQELKVEFIEDEQE